MNIYSNIDLSIKEDQDVENNFYDNLPSLLPLNFNSLNKTPSFTTWCNLKLTPIPITSDDHEFSDTASSASLNHNNTAAGDIKNMEQIIRTIKTEINQKNYLFESFCNNQDMINFQPLAPSAIENNNNNTQNINNQILQSQNDSPQNSNLSTQNQNSVKNYQVQQQHQQPMMLKTFEEGSCGFSSNSLVRQISQQMQQIQQQPLCRHKQQQFQNSSQSTLEESKIQNFNCYNDLTVQQKMIIQNQYEIQNVNQQIAANLNDQVNSMLLGQKRPKRKFTEQRKNYNEQDSFEDEFESTEDEKQEKRVPCNCKKSKCLKLYCECFAAGLMCMKECNCCECNNLEQFAKKRDIAMNILLEKNPNAFMNKIVKPSILYQNLQTQLQNQQLQQNQNQQQIYQQQQEQKPQIPDAQSECNSGSSGTLSSEIEQHIKGCNCKKSHCLKKYCECYNGGVKCSSLCKCEGCKNGNSESDNEVEEDQMSDFNEDEIQDGYNKPRKQVKKNKKITNKIQEPSEQQQLNELDKNIKTLRQQFQNGQFIPNYNNKQMIVS